MALKILNLKKQSPNNYHRKMGNSKEEQRS